MIEISRFIAAAVVIHILKNELKEEALYTSFNNTCLPPDISPEDPIGGYDVRRNQTDEVINSIEQNIGTLYVNRIQERVRFLAE